MTTEEFDLTSDADDTDVREFACSGPVTAGIRLTAGVLTLTTTEDQSAAAQTTVAVAVSPFDHTEASISAAEGTKIRFDGDRLRVDAPETTGGWIFRRSGRVRIDVRLPAGSRLQVHAGSADVHVDGRLALANIHLASGDCHIAQTTGDLVVESASGEIRADSVGGALRAKSASGGIMARSVSGAVTAHSASGDLEIEEAGGPVRASSASGDITIGAMHGWDAHIDSASGDVSVGVPAGTTVWLDLSTMSGSTATDLAITPQRPVAQPPPGSAQLQLRVRTMSGDINVHRVAGPPPTPSS